MAIGETDTRITRKLVKGISVVVVVIVCIGIANLISLRMATRTYARREQAHSVLDSTHTMYSSMLGIVSATRGFVITAQDKFLDSIDREIINFEQAYDSLDGVLQDTTVNLRRMELIRLNYKTIVHELEEPLIDFRSSIGTNQFSPELMELFMEVSTRSRYVIDETLRLIGEIQNSENQQLTEMETRLKTVLGLVRLLNMFGPIGILLVMLVMARAGLAKVDEFQKDRQIFELDLEKSRKRLASVIEGTDVGTWEWEIDSGNLILNECWAQILGYHLEELLPTTDKTWEDFAHPDDFQISRLRTLQTLDGTVDFYDTDMRMRHVDGHWVWMHIRGKVVERTPQGEPMKMAGTCSDLSARKEMQELLAFEKDRLRATLFAITEGLVATDIAGKVQMMNPLAERLTGWQQADAVGIPFSTVFRIKQEDAEEPDKNIVRKVLESGESSAMDPDTILIARDGTSFYVECLLAPIVNKQGEVDGVVAVFKDVSEEKKQQDALAHLVFRDPLTGLHNRRFYDQQKEYLDAPEYYPLAFVTADVDGLKLTNDAFGHEAGDRLLQIVGKALDNSCRVGDVVSRIGGDEFVMLLPKTTADQVERIVKRIISSLKTEKNYDLPVSVSFGFAVKETVLEDMADVIKQAEDSMYQQKIVESPKMKKLAVDHLLEAQFQKDAWEYEHCMAISKYSEELAREMGFSDEDAIEMKTAGLYHDIGKIAIDPSILNKPTALDSNEWDAVRRHSELGYTIVRTVNEYAAFANHILHHHERWDGQGYPHGLSGEDIPIRARLLCVVDAYVAMVSNRPYRDALGMDAAIEQLRIHAGSQFDPHIARLFVEKVLHREWL